MEPVPERIAKGRNQAAAQVSRRRTNPVITFFLLLLILVAALVAIFLMNSPWWPARGALLQTMQDQVRGPHLLAWSPDSTLLATESYVGEWHSEVRIWQAGGNLVHILEGEQCPAWSPHGSLLSHSGSSRGKYLAR